jgi:hypothetical protein
MTELGDVFLQVTVRPTFGLRVICTRHASGKKKTVDSPPRADSIL